MEPIAPVELRLVRGGAQPDAVRATTRWRRLWVWAALCIVAAAAVGYSDASGRRRTARSIPDEQRIALFQRTLDEVKQSCGGRLDGLLEEHCRELASFLSRFDECRGGCEELIRSHLAANPTR